MARTINLGSLQSYVESNQFGSSELQKDYALQRQEQLQETPFKPKTATQDIKPKPTALQFNSFDAVSRGVSSPAQYHHMKCNRSFKSRTRSKQSNTSQPK
jgi:hypothetical protein